MGCGPSKTVSKSITKRGSQGKVSSESSPMNNSTHRRSLSQPAILENISLVSNRKVSKVEEKKNKGSLNFEQILPPIQRRIDSNPKNLFIGPVMKNLRNVAAKNGGEIGTSPNISTGKKKNLEMIGKELQELIESIVQDELSASQSKLPGTSVHSGSMQKSKLSNVGGNTFVTFYNQFNIYSNPSQSKGSSARMNKASQISSQELLSARNGNIIHCDNLTASFRRRKESRSLSNKSRSMKNSAGQIDPMRNESRAGGLSLFGRTFREDQSKKDASSVQNEEEHPNDSFERKILDSKRPCKMSSFFKQDSKPRLQRNSIRPISKINFPLKQNNLSNSFNALNHIRSIQKHGTKKKTVVRNVLDTLSNAEDESEDCEDLDEGRIPIRNPQTPLQKSLFVDPSSFKKLQPSKTVRVISKLLPDSRQVLSSSSSSSEDTEQMHASITPSFSFLRQSKTSGMQRLEQNKTSRFARIGVSTNSKMINDSDSAVVRIRTKKIA